MASKLTSTIGAVVAGLLVAGGAVAYFTSTSEEHPEVKQVGGSAVAVVAPTKPQSSLPAKEPAASARTEQAMLSARHAAMSAADGSPRSMTDFFRPVPPEESTSSLHQSAYSSDDLKAIDRILAEGRIKVARLTVSASREMALQIKSAGLVQKVHVSGRQEIVLAYAPGTQVEVYCDDPADTGAGTLNLWVARRMFPLQPIAPGASLRLRTPSA